MKDIVKVRKVNKDENWMDGLLGELLSFRVIYRQRLKIIYALQEQMSL